MYYPVWAFNLQKYSRGLEKRVDLEEPYYLDRNLCLLSLKLKYNNLEDSETVPDFARMNCFEVAVVEVVDTGY